MSERRQLTGNDISDIVYVTKGLAITLLVAAHYHFPESADTVEPGYWIMTGYISLEFLMPLFMMLSGFLFGFTMKSVTMRKYPRFVGKKFLRLMLPYLSVSLLLVAAKLAAMRFAELQYPVNSDVWKSIIIYPLAEDYSTMLWFLYALFLVFLIVPPLMTILKNDIAILAAALVLSSLPWTDTASLSKVFLLLPFFWLGYLAKKHAIIEKSNPVPVFVVFTAVFSLLAMLKWLPMFHVDTPATQFVLSFTGCVSCTFFCAILAGHKGIIRGTLKSLGFYSLSIYLFHTIAMGPARIVLFRLLKQEGLLFIATVPVACAFGLAIPVILDKYILRPNRAAAAIFLGVIPKRRETV